MVKDNFSIVRFYKNECSSIELSIINQTGTL
jgi:hypothetical protein